MATKKDSGSGRYRVLRDCPVGAEGDIVTLTDEDAADLTRDGMVTPTDAGGGES
jgi:hypothetical protein